MVPQAFFFLLFDLFEDDFCINLKHIFSLNQFGETEVQRMGLCGVKPPL